MIYTKQRHETKNLKNQTNNSHDNKQTEFDYKDCSCLLLHYLFVLETSFINYYSFVDKNTVIKFDYSIFNESSHVI